MIFNQFVVSLLNKSIILFFFNFFFKHTDPKLLNRKSAIYHVYDKKKKQHPDNVLQF